MSWFAIFNSTTGGLVSVGTVIAAPLPQELTSVSVGDTAPKGNWNVVTRVFDIPPIVKPVLEPIEFLRLFTFAEEVAIRTAAKTDVGIEVFLARLAASNKVHLDHPDTRGGMGYLVAKSLITPARSAEILA